MMFTAVHVQDKNHRQIACETCLACRHPAPTMFWAYASDEVLAAYEVADIADMDDEDLRREARGCHPSCWIEGRCLTCNGPDDGNCGDGEDFHN